MGIGLVSDRGIYVELRCEIKNYHFLVLWTDESNHEPKYSFRGKTYCFLVVVYIYFNRDTAFAAVCEITYLSVWLGYFRSLVKKCLAFACTTETILSAVGYTNNHLSSVITLSRTTLLFCYWLFSHLFILRFTSCLCITKVHWFCNLLVIM